MTRPLPGIWIASTEGWEAMSIEQKLNRAISAILDAKADLACVAKESGATLEIRRAVNELDVAELDIENAIRELSGQLC